MLKPVSVILCCIAAPLFGQSQPDGKALFAANCAMCHAPGGDARAPLPEVLQQRPNESIIVALEAGPMRSQGARMTAVERRAVANYLSPRTAADDQPPKPNNCASNKPLENLNGWQGWGVDLQNSRFQTAAGAGLSASDIPKLKVKWAFGVPYEVTVEAQPTVIGDRVYFGSATGAVYSLDAKTGCQYWSFKADTRMRTAINVAKVSGQNMAYFGDSETNVYAVNAETGKLIWRTRLDEHPMAGITGAPKFYNGRLYVGVRSSSEEVAAGDPKYPCCTFRGSMVALDAANGKVIWKTYTVKDAPAKTKVSTEGTQLWGPSGVGIWSSPALDTKRGLIYAGTGNNYSDPPTNTSDAILAFDMKTGELKWSKQLTEDAWNASCGRPGKPSCPANPDRDVDFASAPIIRTLANGKDVIIAGQKSGDVYALDPENKGAVIWKKTIAKGGANGGIQWGMATDADNVYLPISDIIPGPGGGLFALKIANGEQMWYVAPAEPACKGKRGCSQAQLAAATAIPGAVFSGSMDGHLRAFNTKDGSVLLDFDTLHDYDTVNGVKAHGGSMNVSGPAIANGMVFVNSGYNVMIGMPGNVVLALSVDGK